MNKRHQRANFPPLAKGGARGVGAGQTSAVATALCSENRIIMAPPLAKGGPGAQREGFFTR